MQREYTFVDLFAGCGGLSEGFYHRGYTALAHVEIDKWCCQTLRERMRHYSYSEADIAEAVIEADMQSVGIEERVKRATYERPVDVVIGGPPCQAYSSAGRARDEQGMKNDPRNYLFEHYARILDSFMPKIFVFENVTGLLTAQINGVKIVSQVLKRLSANYDVAYRVYNTANFGVPQIRKRVIIIGVRKDLDVAASKLHAGIKSTHYDPEMTPLEIGGLKHWVSVRDAIGDLPAVAAGAKAHALPFEYPAETNEFVSVMRAANTKGILYDHVTRTQNDTDTERYQEMAKNNWAYPELLEKRPDLRHENEHRFCNSYQVQFWDLPARTLIAHLGKDGNQFIHPDWTQGRSISVREAARLQSFPDDFRFAGAMGQQFKQIGNAVPPLFAEVLAKSVEEWLDKMETK